LDLQCQIYGIPRPEILWLKEDQILQEDDRTMFIDDAEASSTYGLVINNVVHSDEAMYKIVARNEGGEALSATRVHIISSSSDATPHNRKRRICSIPEEGVHDEDEGLEQEQPLQPVSTVVTTFTRTLYVSKSISSAPSTDHYTTNTTELASSDRGERHLLIRKFTILPSNKDDNEVAVTATHFHGIACSRPPTVKVANSYEYFIYYSILAIHVICFAAPVFVSGPNAVVADLLRCSALLAMLVFWCMFDQK
jgi:hypothetical protein